MRQDDSNLAEVDSLSSIGRQLLRLDAEHAYLRLVVDSPGNLAAKSMLESLSAGDLIDGPIPIINRSDAQGVMAGLWLRHDWLEESHRISQQLETSSGSMWHAIMHRREGDFSNSKYWYNRAAAHPVLKTLPARAGETINNFPADKSVFRIIASGWNPAAFVDLVEAVHDKPNDPRHRLATVIQEIEWRLLFEHCTRGASGK
ncbi:MAG TPA: hypothetical protein VKK61_04410 [Tepidisphaeraceae bacterium]|nr:hypothetical protein [Tepidisphaeraceae bacterium]